MKKEWVSPQTIVEKFEANEYVAACGDTEYGKYKFTCTAGGGTSGTVYQETNRKDGLQTRGNIFAGYQADTWLGGYHACNASHEADTTDEFVNGYYVVDRKVTPVIIWKGENGDNIHCTINLDRDSWEVVKS